MDVAYLTMKLPGDLKRELETEADALGISVSAAARLRLRGNCVTLTSAARMPPPIYISAPEAERTRGKFGKYNALVRAAQ
jgi:hypothetical protein